MQTTENKQVRHIKLILGIDTCGPTGSVALARLAPDSLDILGQIELAGHTYSERLIGAVGELLAQAGARVRDLDALVATHGPGSFTGVRLGLAAVKGLAEPARTPVVAVSRLAVLAARAEADCAALDAHRHEVFLRMATPGTEARELLADAAELAGLTCGPQRIGVCDDAAAELLGAAWPEAEVVRVAPPTAADALALAAPLIRAGSFVDLLQLDGHYLRRSDAEIFGHMIA